MSKKDEELTFETIAQVYREERNSTALTKLQRHFYKDLNDYLEKLRSSYLEERNHDPTSSKTLMLEDEYNKAQRRASQIYEHRERKIVLLALSAVNGGSPNLSQMTNDEKIAFDNLVDTLKKNRSHILLRKEEDTCESKSFLISEQKSVKAEPADEIEGHKKLLAEEEMKVKGENESFDEIQQENPVLLILEDILSFETEERTFDLKKNDAVSLPRKVAKILCRSGKARVIKGCEKK